MRLPQFLGNLAWSYLLVRRPADAQAAAEKALAADPSQEWIPAAPAAHYLCGGVLTDLNGATTLPGCWAVGEVACSGIHGANRLASNSLLEGTVFGARVAHAIASGAAGPTDTGALRGVGAGRAIARGAPANTAGDEQVDRERLQRLMTREVGILRDSASLQRAATAIGAWRTTSTDHDGLATITDHNLATVAAAVVASAIARTESRGTHTRTDHPAASDYLCGRFVHIAGDLRYVPAP